MTIDLEERLRADLPRLADLIEGEKATATLVADSPRRRGRPLIVLGAAASVLLAVIAVVTLSTRARNHTVSVSTPRPATMSTWHALPPSGLGARGGAVVVWTGREVLVWGGYRGDLNGLLALQSGAAYDPTTGAWRAIADNQWAHPGAVGVWASDRLYVLAKNGGAVYSPATNTWHDIGMLPESSGGFIGGTWSGTTLFGVVYGGSSRTIQIATYDATRDTWSIGSQSPPSWPDVSRVPVAYLNGAVVVSDTQKHALQYIPATDTWSPLPALPDDTAASSIIAFDGSTVAVTVTRQGALTASRYDGGRWTVLTDPVATSFKQPVAVDAGGSLIVIDASGQGTPVRMDESGHTWVPLPGYPLGPGATTTPVWASTGLFVWGGLPAGTAVTTPPGSDSTAPTRPEGAWYGP